MTASSIPGELRRQAEQLAGLPRNEGGPVFAEAWHAEVFAITLALVERDQFSWAEWTAALAEAIAAAQLAGDADLGDTYYDHWLAALELLCARTGAASTDEVDLRQQDWRDAYERTPHGQPVEL